MTALMSENLANAIHEQIGHEKYNSHLYLYVCGYLRNKGLNGLAKHFEEQHEEEFRHSKMFFDLLTDLNTEVKFPEIDEIKIPINNVLDVAKLYLDREGTTTYEINSNKELSLIEAKLLLDNLVFS